MPQFNRIRLVQQAEYEKAGATLGGNQHFAFCREKRAITGFINEIVTN